MTTGEFPPDAGSDPDYRFSLANERTFLAWIRTALALIAGAVAVLQIVPPFAVPGARAVLGVGLAATGLLTAVVARARWRSTETAMRLGRRLGAPPVLVVTVAVAAVAGLVVALGLLPVVTGEPAR